MLSSILRYTFITAFRDKLYNNIIVAICLVMIISWYITGSAFVEKDATAIAYVAGTTRILVVIGMMLFICVHAHRMIETKELEIILSRPFSREYFVLSYWISCVAVAVCILIPVVVFFIIFFTDHFIDILLWTQSVVIELLITISFTIVAAIIFNNILTAFLTSGGFYVLSRMMSAFLESGDQLLLYSDSLYGRMAKFFLKTVATVLPRLDLCGQSAWLIYGTNKEELTYLTIQAIIYTPLLLIMATSDIHRKQL